MKKKLLLTGGVGFIGHHIVEGILKETDWDIVILDSLSYASNLNRLLDIKIWGAEKHRVKFVWWDLKSELNDYIIKDIGDINYIWHLAANSHVDKSIENPIQFLMDNTVGTVNLLEYARKVEPELFVYFSTDEVFGPAPENLNYEEGARHCPGNPYASSKAAAEDMCVAYANTYKLPVIITNTMNVYGERQHPEKFIPIIMRKVLSGDKLTVHDGSRFWIHARNACEALIFLTKECKERVGSIDASIGRINIVGEVEKTNLELALFIAEVLDKPLSYEVVDSRECRPGHDRRYGLSGDKLKKMGFEYSLSFEESLAKTINWYFEGNNKEKWL